MNIGCGRTHIEDEFVPYVSQFEQEALKRGKQIQVKTSIEFGTPPFNEAIGYCDVNPFNKKIIIYEPLWSRFGELSKRALLFHELGHCELGKFHDDTEGSVQIEGITYPTVSIMNSHIGKIIKNYWRLEAFYLDSFFDVK
jgi:hypothetical protein